MDDDFIRKFAEYWKGPVNKKHPSFEEGIGSPTGPVHTANLKFQKLEMGYVAHEAEDYAETLPYSLFPEFEKEAVPGLTHFSSLLVKHWKLATAAGLVGLYLAKPLSLFSGRDDQYNTIEGMRHGGLSQRMRRDMTPFGSGWDPLRALAKEAGMTMEKFVRQPHFKLAMASGDVVRELGQGSFGKVHLMESTINIGGKERSFQYARKTMLGDNSFSETFHEVKAQRQLQGSNAPSVYGWSGNQIFMEPIHGQSAMSFMREGKQLPESFMKDLESFLPEMHSRGIAHTDMTRDVNRLLGKEGSSGEIIPHNIMVTHEGRAAVIDYGMNQKATESNQTLQRLYNRTKYNSNADFDMSLVHSLRQNQGKLSEKSLLEFQTKTSTTQYVAPPSAKTFKAKSRDYAMSEANKATAKEMFRVGSGRRSKNTFR